jgi:hypothetical protein
VNKREKIIVAAGVAAFVIAVGLTKDYITAAVTGTAKTVITDSVRHVIPGYNPSPNVPQDPMQMQHPIPPPQQNKVYIFEDKPVNAEENTEDKHNVPPSTWDLKGTYYPKEFSQY